MAAVNKYPWVRNVDGASEPMVFYGAVQAGSTAAIKSGEICTFNETAGYWIPATAAADQAYSLAISAEEQTATDVARYMKFYGLRRGDVWEFALSAAAAATYGYALEISDSQTLAYDADRNAIAFQCTAATYPTTGTTIGSVGYTEAIFHPAFSYIYKNVIPRGLKKVMAKTAAYTLTLEDCGAIVSNKGAGGSVTITAPEGVVPIGWNVTLFVAAAQALVFDPKPNGAALIVAGGVQTAGKYMSMTDEGDFAEVVWDGTDWLVVNSPSAADGDITIEG